MASVDACAKAKAAAVATEENGQEVFAFRLTGSQAKTAYALEKNVARMIEESGLERCGFLTLTVGDAETCEAAGCKGCERGEHFRQVWDAADASRRIHSLQTGLLADLFPRAVIVTERHKSGAIHFHLIVEQAADIRAGFDFEAFLDARRARQHGRCDVEAERRYQASATPALRRLWAILRDRLPSYGFGRAELTPIFKTGEAVSRYVSKYVEKNLFNRPAEDKRKKLVRYMGWNGEQMKPNEFGWCNERATAWRNKARDLASLAGVASRGEVAAAFGPRWSFKLTRVMQAIDDRPRPAFEWTYTERETARGLVHREAKQRWLEHRQADNGVLPSEVHWRPRAAERLPELFTFEADAEWTQPTARQGGQMNATQ